MEFIHTTLGDWPDIDFRRLSENRPSGCDVPREAFIARGRRAEENLHALVSGGAYCVTTGQQPGLFLGPLYTVFKALAAVVAAERLEAQLGNRVIPVFWVAGDDHDFAESNHFNLPGRDENVEQIVLRERPAEAPSAPLYREGNGPDTARALKQALDLLPPTEFRDDIEKAFAKAYRAESNLAESFAELLADLLGEFGLVVFVATRAEAKPSQMELLLRALESAPNLDDALAARATEMDRDGQRVPVKVGDGATLVMVEASLGRDRLMIEGDNFRTRRSGEIFSLDQLRAVAAEDPCRLSANVLLRPVVEAAILPTLAYLGGPGELAYFGQCDPIYELMGVTAQAKIPRWSALVVEPRVRKILNKYSLSPADLSGPAGELETRIARDDLPSEVTAALSQIRQSLQNNYSSVIDAAVAIDPTLKKPIETARNMSLSQTKDAEKKILSHLKRKNETVLRQIARARSDLYPGGTAQERVISVLPFLVRYGRNFLNMALEASREQFAADATAVSE